MKLFLIVVSICCHFSYSYGQVGRQSSSLSGISYSVPKSWAIDDFSSSSVCDCYGTIILDYNSKPDLKIAIYPYLDSDTAMFEREFVWGSQFKTKKQLEHLTISKREFLVEQGILEGRKPSFSYRLKPVSNHAKRYNHIIYIFSESDSLNFEDERIQEFIASIRLTKK